MIARTSYTPAAVNPFIRLALFDNAMAATDRIAAEEWPS